MLIKNKTLNFRKFLFMLLIVLIFLVPKVYCTENLISKEDFIEQLKELYPENFSEPSFPDVFYVTNPADPDDTKYISIKAIKKDAGEQQVFKKGNTFDLDQDGELDFFFLHKGESYQGALSVWHKKGAKFSLCDFILLPPGVQYLRFISADFISLKEKRYALELSIEYAHQAEDPQTSLQGLTSKNKIFVYEMINKKIKKNLKPVYKQENKE